MREDWRLAAEEILGPKIDAEKKWKKKAKTGKKRKGSVSFPKRTARNGGGEGQHPHTTEEHWGVNAEVSAKQRIW